MVDFRDEQGNLHHEPRFDPDPSGNIEEQASAYLDRTGQYPPGYLLVERIVLGFGRFFAAVYNAVRRR